MEAPVSPRPHRGVAGPAARCYHHCPPPSVALLLLKDALSSLVHEMNLSLLYSAMFCWVLKLVAAAWGAAGVGRRRAGRRGMLSYLVCTCVWVLHLVSDWEETVLEVARTVLLCYEVIWSVALLSDAFDDCVGRDLSNKMSKNGLKVFCVSGYRNIST